MTGSFEPLPEIEKEKEEKEIEQYKISRIENDITLMKLKLNEILKIVKEIKNLLEKN